MKKSQSRIKLSPSASKDSPQLLDEIDLLRRQVAVAEAVLAEARENAARAKRRRKLAKLMARRARKEAKQAKARLDEIREALARVQNVARVRTRQRRAAQRKAGKPDARRTERLASPKSRRVSPKHVIAKPVASHTTKAQKPKKAEPLPPASDSLPITPPAMTESPSLPSSLDSSHIATNL